MKAFVEVDAKLMEAAFRLSGEPSRSAAVEKALREYVRSWRKTLLLELPDNIRLDKDWQGLRKAELEE